MIEQSLGQNYSRVVNVLIFIFPIVINSLQVVGDIVLSILAMIGMFIAFSQKLSPFRIKETKVLSYITIGYFIAICLSVVFSGYPLEIAHYIPRDFYFLCAPFIALTIYKADININYLLMGVKVSLLVLGLIAYDHLSSGVNRGPGNIGVINAGVFGNLSVSLFFIVLAFLSNESFKHKVFTLLTLSFGLLAIIASGTRGAWLSFLTLSGVYIYFFYKQTPKLSMRSKIITVIIISVVISLVSSNQGVKDRASLAYTQTSNWMSGEEGSSINSVGLRLEMYKKAINNIEDVPFFGYGLRTSNINLFKNDSTISGRISSRFNHLHNIFLTTYYNGGLVLLGALFVILFVPLTIFIKSNRQDRKNPLFTAGSFLIFGYIAHGMVNILFGDTYMNGFYIFFLIIFLIQTNKVLASP